MGSASSIAVVDQFSYCVERVALRATRGEEKVIGHQPLVHAVSVYRCGSDGSEGVAVCLGVETVSFGDAVWRWNEARVALGGDTLSSSSGMNPVLTVEKFSLRPLDSACLLFLRLAVMPLAQM